MSQIKFKVGDRVRVVSCKQSFTLDFTGRTGKVNSVSDAGGVSVTLENPTSQPLYFDAAELALIEPADAPAPPQPEYTGGSVSYYTVHVARPTNPDLQPYAAECNDIIEALGMTYAEGNAFKAIWRACAARTLGKAKLGYKDALYDAEKVVFFGERMVAMAKGER